MLNAPTSIDCCPSQLGAQMEWIGRLADAPWKDPRTGREYWLACPLPHDQKAACSLTGEGGAAGQDMQFCVLCARTSAQRGVANDEPLLTKKQYGIYEQRAAELDAALTAGGKPDPALFYLPAGFTKNGCKLLKDDLAAECRKRGMGVPGGRVRMPRTNADKEKAIRQYVAEFGWADVDVAKLDMAACSKRLKARGIRLDRSAVPAGMDVIDFVRAAVLKRRNDENELVHLRLVLTTRHPEEYLAQVEQLIPCVLHARMRLLEKWFKLVILALEKADFKQHGGEKAREAQFKAAETYIATHVLGSEEKPANYRLPRTPKHKGGQLRCGMRADRSMRLWKARAGVMQALSPPGADVAVDLALWEPLDHILGVIGEKGDRTYTQGELDAFDRVCTDFFNAGVERYGMNLFASNYMHFIGALHFSKYMKLYGNLQRFSNDGWEALNGKTQYWYAHCTQRGGAQGCKGQREKTARTFANWRKRDMYVKCGFDRRATRTVSGPVGLEAARAAMGAAGGFDERRWAMLPKDGDGCVPPAVWNAAEAQGSAPHSWAAVQDMKQGNGAVRRRLLGPPTTPPPTTPMELDDGDFAPADRFAGSREGFVFTTGSRGLGYYADWRAHTPAASPAVRQQQQQQQQATATVCYSA